MADKVTLTLAHPLDAARAEQHRAADVRDYDVHHEITVPLANAAELINAGYALGVDPNDREAVTKALRLPQPAGQATAAPQAQKQPPPPAA